MRTFSALVVLALVTPSLAAQAVPPHSYLPLDHWSVPFLEHLVQRGVMADPTPLVRPWRASDVTAALAAVDTTTLTRPERGTRAALLEFLRAPVGDHYLAVAGEIGVRASTHARRPQFALRETGPDQLAPRIGFGLGVQFGPGLLLMHPRWDGNLDDDPDYAAKEQPLDVRYEEAYGTIRTRYFDLDLGNVSRNWGPVGVPGLLVSDWPLSYDHLFLRAGHPRVYLTVLVAPLDPALNQAGELSQRFFYAHRFAASPWDWMEVAAWQGTVTGSPGRGLDLYFLNPFKTSFATRDERNDQANVWLGAEGQLRFGNVRLEGALTVDDIQFFKSGGPGDEEPPSFALTATASMPAGPVTLWAGYTLVSNLMYRTVNPAEKPLTAFNAARGRAGNGLARNFSDYDELAVRATFIPYPGIIVAPEIALLRQGEGDIRQPFPDFADFPTTATVFQGIRERVLRAALRGTVRLPAGVDAEFDVAAHRITNAGHVAGASDTRVVATFTARYAIERILSF